jgi:hypothetical protein
VALEDARRKCELGSLSRETALRDLAQEELKLKREADDIERDTHLLAADRQRLQVKVDESRAAPTGLGGAP